MKWILAITLSVIVFVACWWSLEAGAGWAQGDALALAAVPFSLVFGVLTWWAARDQARPVPHSADDIDQLRSRYGVRRISEAEDGLSLHELPFNTFGFTTPWALNDIFAGFGFTKRRRALNSIKHRLDLASSPGGTVVLEVHHLQGGAVEVVGYTSAEEAIKLCNPVRAIPYDLTLYMDATNTKVRPVAIPVCLIRRWKQRSIRGHYVADVTVNRSSHRRWR
ncbi:hypothetical protein [Streptomyces sp. NPDC003720]|uniref:hypothetical protein n=1 Tax=Streptomyces sp. NPDC003720 TaxID=3364684 RepID=UPI00367512E9